MRSVCVPSSYLSCAPRIGLQANAVQRARRMRLESPASPPSPFQRPERAPLSPLGEGAIRFSFENALLTDKFRAPRQPCPCQGRE